MSIIWMLYLINVAENIGVTLAIAWVLALILIITSVGRVITSDDEDANKVVKRILRCATIVLCIALPIDIFIPTKQTMYAMAATEIGERIADRPEVKGLTDDALKAVRVWINKQLTETEGSK